MNSGLDGPIGSTGESVGDYSGTLRGFRKGLYSCFARRTDALFELTDSILNAGCVRSPPHLAATVHRRG